MSSLSLEKEDAMPLVIGGNEDVFKWIEEIPAMSPGEQAFFVIDHLKRSAKNEIKYRAGEDREHPDKIFSVLKVLYGQRGRVTARVFPCPFYVNGKGGTTGP